LKQKREEARRAVDSKQLEMNEVKQSSIARQQAQHAPAGISRKSIRQTQHQNTQNLVGHISKVIQEMSRLEAAIAAAEEGQARAENELIEYANEKRQIENNMAVLAKELERAKEVGQKAIFANGNEMKAGLGELSLIIAKCQQLVSTPASAPGEKIEKPSRRRGNTVDSIVPNAPPPPMSDFIPTAPHAPPPMAVGAEGGTSLLTQIREGKQLQKVDLGRLRQARARQSRKSMALVQSLTSVLKSALAVRHEDMTGGEEDDDDWEEEETDW